MTERTDGKYIFHNHIVEPQYQLKWTTSWLLFNWDELIPVCFSSYYLGFQLLGTNWFLTNTIRKLSQVTWGQKQGILELVDFSNLCYQNMRTTWTPSFFFLCYLHVPDFVIKSATHVISSVPRITSLEWYSEKE